jgi:hypothetical protein
VALFFFLFFGAKISALIRDLLALQKPHYVHAPAAPPQHASASVSIRLEEEEGGVGRYADGGKSVVFSQVCV